MNTLTNTVNNSSQQDAVSVTSSSQANLKLPLPKTATLLVSVVIPVYNGAKYIQIAIDSVLKQTYGNYEIIIIDDGSTDDTRQKLQPYKNKIRYIYQENQGSAAARNTGISLAKGELIAFLDADDFWAMSDKLTKQVALFNNNPSLGCVNTGWKIVDGAGKHIKTVQPWHKAPKLDLETWLKKKCVRTSAMVFRKHWLEKVGGFDEELRQSHDVDLALRLSLAGCETVWLEEATVCYRQHDKNTTKNSLKQAKYVQAVLDKFFARQDLPESISKQESQIRYHTLVWIAWYQYRAGNLDEMTKFLQKSLDFSPYLRVENISHWLSSFKRFSQERGLDFNTDFLTDKFQWKQLIALTLNLKNTVNEHIFERAQSNINKNNNDVDIQNSKLEIVVSNLDNLKKNKIDNTQNIQTINLDNSLIEFKKKQTRKKPKSQISQDHRSKIQVNFLKIQQRQKEELNKAKKYQETGESLHKKDKIEDAIISYQKAVELNSDKEAVEKLSTLFKKKIEPTIAADMSVEDFRKLGEKWKKQGKIYESIALYRLAIDRIPNSHKLYRTFGDTLREYGQVDWAISAYNQSIKLNSKFAWSYKGLGEALAINAQKSEAVQAYEKAIELKPKLLKDVYSKLSSLLCEQQRWNEAIKLSQSALEIYADKSELRIKIHEKLGDIFVVQKNFDRGCINFFKCLQIKPDYFPAYEKIADVLEQQGRPILPEANATTPSTYCHLPQDIIEEYTNLSTDWLSKLDSNLSSIEYIPVYHPTQTIFTATNTLEENNIPECMNSQVLNLAPAFVTVIPEGEVWADRVMSGVITKDRKILANTHSGSISLILSSEVLSSAEYVDGKVAFLSVRWGHRGYFHWIYDILARVELLSLAGIDLNSIDKFVINKFDQKFQLETFAHLGIPKEKIIESLEVPHIQAKSLIVPSLPQLRAYRDAKWACKALRDRFVKPEDLQTFNKVERIYINRLDAPHRRVVNEDKVIDFLKSWGFTSIALESMSFSEQVLCMASARVVFAVHGAGLSNIVFCNPGTKIIEVFSPAHVQNTYWRISNACDLEHYHLMSDDTSPDVNLSERSVKRDVCVNLNELTRIFQQAGIKKPISTQESYKKQIRLINNNCVLYRILGNDLPPRHKKGQTLENLTFILDHEPTLENCEKRWVINRINDQEQERKIIKLLESRGQDYIHIPFLEEEYNKVGFNYQGFPQPDYLDSTDFNKLPDWRKERAKDHIYHNKNLYAMNNNGARNIALREGKNLAKWVLPWDGNCFLTQQAWQEILKGINQFQDSKYFIVPMARILSNDQLLDPNFRPDANEEPQIIFRQDSTEEFDERTVRYGHFSKIELFWRLGVPGKWEKWKQDPWDKKGRKTSWESGDFQIIGWVARLFSGQKHLEQSSKERNNYRMQSIWDMLDQLNEQVTNPDK